MMDTSDADLLRRLGDATLASDAMAALIARYGDLVYASSRRQVRDPGDAADVTQAVFIVLHRKAEHMRADRLAGWLLQTCRYAANDLLKARHRRDRHERAASAARDARSSIDWDALSTRVDDALSRLNDRQRTIVALKFLQNRIYAEVGTAVGLSEDAARIAATRAIAKLRSMLAGRSFAASAGGIAALLASHGSEAAPASLATSVSTAIASGQAFPLAAATLQTVRRAEWWAGAKVAGVAAGLIGLAGVSVVTPILLAAPAIPSSLPAVSPAAAQPVHMAVGELGEIQTVVVEDFTTGTGIVGIDFDRHTPIRLRSAATQPWQSPAETIGRNFAAMGVEWMTQQALGNTGMDLALHQPAGTIDTMRWILASEHLHLVPIPTPADFTAIDASTACSALRASAERFDLATTRTADSPLLASRLAVLSPLVLDPSSFPATYAFHTRDGTTGVLQVVAARMNDSTSSVEIRYRTMPRVASFTREDGTTFTLLGITRYPSEDSGWWMPDGQPLTMRPSIKREFDASRERDDVEYFEFAWRQDQPWQVPSTQPTDTENTSSGGSMTISPGEHWRQPRLPPGSAVEIRQQVAIGIPSAEVAATATVRQSFATGPSRPIATFDRQADGTFVDPNRRDLSFPKVEDEGRTQYAINLPRDESVTIGAIAIDDSGTSHRCWSMFDFRTSTLQFEPMSSAKDVVIRRFEILERDEEWVEIRNVSLSPKRPTTPTVVRTPSDDQLIVPGVRVGPVRLGMTRSEVEALLGKADRVDDEGAHFGEVGMVVTFADDGVTRIAGGQLHGERPPLERFTATTRNLIGLGSDVSLITTTFAESDVQRAREVQPLGAYRYPRNGIEFILRDDKLIRIEVFPATPEWRAPPER